MRPPHFPAFLDLAGKRVLVAGGGPVAARKARELARCGARVVLVAPRVCAQARRWAWRVARREFRPADVRGAALVVSAVDDASVSARVARACRRRGVWSNAADRPRLCDFISPAVLRRGRITVAVSTGGASPALARVLRRRLEPALTAADSRLAAKLARLRPRLLELPMAERRRLIARLLEEAA